MTKKRDKVSEVEGSPNGIRPCSSIISGSEIHENQDDLPSDFTSPLRLLDLLNPPSFANRTINSQLLDSPLSTPPAWNLSQNVRLMETTVENSSLKNTISALDLFTNESDVKAKSPISTTERNFRPRSRFVNYSDRAYWKNIDKSIKKNEKNQNSMYTLDQLLQEKKKFLQNDSTFSPFHLSKFDTAFLSPLSEDDRSFHTSPLSSRRVCMSNSNPDSRPNISCFQTEKSTFDVPRCCVVNKNKIIPQTTFQNFLQNLYFSDVYHDSEYRYPMALQLIYTACCVAESFSSSFQVRRRSSSRIEKPQLFLDNDYDAHGLTPLLALNTLISCPYSLPFFKIGDFLSFLSSLHIRQDFLASLHSIYHSKLDSLHCNFSSHFSTDSSNTLLPNHPSFERFLIILSFYLKKTWFPAPFAPTVFILLLHFALDKSIAYECHAIIYDCLRDLLHYFKQGKGDNLETGDHSEFLAILEIWFFSSVELTSFVVHVFKELDSEWVQAVGLRWIDKKRKWVTYTPKISDKQRECPLNELHWSDDDFGDSARFDDKTNDTVNTLASSDEIRTTPVLPEIKERLSYVSQDDRCESPECRSAHINEKACPITLSVKCIREFLGIELSRERLLSDDTDFVELYYEMCLISDVLYYVLEKKNCVDITVLDDILLILQTAGTIIPDVRGLKLDRSMVKNRLQMMSHILYFKYLHGRGGQRDLDII